MSDSPYKKGVLYEIPIIDFRPDPNQPRKVFDPEALEELAESLRKHGMLQPVLFCPDGQGWLRIVAGERRVEAARRANLNLIPSLYVEGDTEEIALVENLQRQDLTAVEEAEAMKRLMEAKGYNQEQLAGMLGKARQTVNEILLVNRLPVAIRDACRGDRTVSRTALIEMARKKQTRSMETAYEKYREKLRRQQEGRQRRAAGEIADAPEDTLRWLQKTVSKLRAVDMAAWTPEERETLHGLLVALEETLPRLRPPRMDLR